MLFHAQYFMLYNSMFDDSDGSDHIVSLMAHLSHTHTHTVGFLPLNEHVRACTLTQMHTERWADEWADLIPTFTYWCAALQHI